MKSSYTLFLTSLLQGFGLSVAGQYLVLIICIPLSLTLKAQHNYDNQSIIYSNNGKVGIGAAIPTERLDVNGKIKAKTLKVFPDPNERYTVFGGVNNFATHGSGVLVTTFLNQNIAKNTALITGLSGTSGANAELVSILYHHNTNLNSKAAMSFATNNGNGLQENMRITSGGKVGIGTTSPTHKLEVVGGSQPDAALKVVGDQWAHIDLPLGSGRDGAAIHAQLVGANSCSGCFRTALIAESKVTQTADVATNVGLFASASGASANYAAIFEKGKVGIGTTSPAEKLHVEGNILVGSGNNHQGIKKENARINLYDPWKNMHLETHDMNTSGFYVDAANYYFRRKSDRRVELKIDNEGLTLLDKFIMNANHPDYSILMTPRSSDNTWFWNGQFGYKKSSNSWFFGHIPGIKLGIGTNTPTEALEVNGNIKAKSIRTNGLKVYGEVSAKKFRTSSTGADFVFEPDYKLLKLEEVAEYVKDHKHLPDLAPAKTMQAEGIDLGEMNTKLLQKVEELTLYLIDQNQKIIEQNRKIAKQNQKIKTLEQKVITLEQR